MDYKILEHPADVKVQALGKTKEELFRNAMLGMNAVLRPKIKDKKQKIKNKIKIESLDIDALLVDFLSEVLYLSQINQAIYNKVEFKQFSDQELEAEVVGSKVESFGEDIKAVTYHDLKIKKNKKGLWEVIVLFDI